MGLEEIAQFLDDHPDWCPAVLLGQIDGEDAPVFYGFYGPQGGYFTPEEIARLSNRPRSWGSWKKRRQ